MDQGIAADSSPELSQVLAVGDGKKVDEILRTFGKLEVCDSEGKKVMGVVP